MEVRDIDSIELQLILPYLISENYVETNNDWQDGDTLIGYKIRFNGKVFIENGGFVAKFNRENIETKGVKNIQTTTLLLTCILALSALIAAVYYIHEIWKYYYGYVNPNSLP